MVISHGHDSTRSWAQVLTFQHPSPREKPWRRTGKSKPAVGSQGALCGDTRLVFISQPAKNVSLKMTSFWELAASYFSGARKALKPTSCQSLRAINMWFCHTRSFSLLLPCWRWVFYFFFLFEEPLGAGRFCARSYGSLLVPQVGPRTTQGWGEFTAKPQACNAGHLAPLHHNFSQPLPFSPLFLSLWGKNEGCVGGTSPTLPNLSPISCNVHHHVTLHPVQLRWGPSQEASS